MKPLGIAIGISGNGPTLHVTGTGRTENKIWDAVEEAMDEGWTLKQVIAEVRQAWEYERKKQLARELDEAE